MGNQNSRNAAITAGSTPHSPATPSSSSHATAIANALTNAAASQIYNNNNNHAASQQQQQRKEPRRRESIQALSSAKATAAPPSASFESATAQQQQPQSHPHSSPSAPSSRHHSRSHSRTIATPQLRPQDSIATPDKMGSQQSNEKADAASAATAARDPTSTPPARPSPLTRPVDVRTPSNDLHNPSPIDPTAAPQDQYQLPPSQYTRPPRLPLPIEEEVHTPGSPIISPADITSPIDPLDVDGVLPRKTSVLSTTTVDDDDIGDELHPVEGGGRTVPTVIEWRGPGERVYVTGTFAGWDRKHRLHRDGPSKHKDALSATINLPPGTHHLKFIVDGEMRLSDDLPTAVDFTNILVNYLEVSPDDLPPAPPTEPIDIPPVSPKTEYRVPPGLFPPQVLPPTPELQPASPTPPQPQQKPPHPVTGPPSQHPPADPAASASSKPTLIAPPSSPTHYYATIPAFLLDLDGADDSPMYERASAAVGSAPAPPSLPMFLGKSILNGATPMKDDSSVLIMPNHTVLNHLATSSIKDRVLATSATTRYQRKFLTTIMYKPTSEDGD